MKTKKATSKIGIRSGCVVVCCFCLFTFYFLLSPPSAAAQRDYLTEAEIELIRDAQQIDERVDVLIHAIDRRFGVLQIEVGGSKKENKDWGELPKGTRRELLYDIKKLLQKAIDDIDNLSERPDSIVVNPEEKNKKPKGFAELFPKAVRKLDTAARRYQPALKAALAATKDPVEQGSLIDSLEMCDQINAAVPKLPPEVKKGKN
jgi:hypothetical protein